MFHRLWIKYFLILIWHRIWKKKYLMIILKIITERINSLINNYLYFWAVNFLLDLPQGNLMNKGYMCCKALTNRSKNLHTDGGETGCKKFWDMVHWYDLLLKNSKQMRTLKCTGMPFSFFGLTWCPIKLISFRTCSWDNLK